MAAYRRRIEERFGDIFHEPELRAQLSIEDLVRRQIERVNIASSFDRRVFAANLGAFKAMLPKHKRMEVEMKAEEYLVVTQQYQYKYNCGVPVGTPENPVMDSPVLVENIDVDWDKLYELMMDALEESGTTWKVEKETIEIGKVEKKRRKGKPTPWFGKKGKAKDESEGRPDN